MVLTSLNVVDVPSFSISFWPPFSSIFLSQIRSTISDFAVFLTIVIMVLIDFSMGIPSPKLHVPSVFKVEGM